MDRLDSIDTLTTDEGKNYYKYIKYPDIPFSERDLYVITSAGDRLDKLAFQFYNDVDVWWVISSANPQTIKRDSFNLKPGIEIRIPADIESIKEEFERINS